MDHREIAEKLRIQEVGRIRHFLNQNPAVGTIAAVVVLLICLILLMARLKGGSSGGTAATIRPVQSHYYDMNTGDMFTAAGGQIPPIKAPSDAGKPDQYSGVRALVFSCEDCGDPTKRFIGLLEQYPLEVKQAMEKARASDDPEEQMALEQLDLGRLICRPEEGVWVEAESDEGRELFKSLATACAGGSRPRPCIPRRK